MCDKGTKRKPDINAHMNIMQYDQFLSGMDRLQKMARGTANGHTSIKDNVITKDENGLQSKKEDNSKIRNDVLDMRFELGRDDNDYLRSDVVALQTISSHDDPRIAHNGVYPEVAQAGRMVSSITRIDPSFMHVEAY
tara:strand:- start:8 stop:418 length:411 start_codon:yes stop_codon:yes gene_type:complete